MVWGDMGLGSDTRQDCVNREQWQRCASRLVAFSRLSPQLWVLQPSPVVARRLTLNAAAGCALLCFNIRYT